MNSNGFANQEPSFVQNNVHMMICTMCTQYIFAIYTCHGNTIDLKRVSEEFEAPICRCVGGFSAIPCEFSFILFLLYFGEMNRNDWNLKKFQKKQYTQHTNTAFKWWSLSNNVDPSFRNRKCYLLYAVCRASFPWTAYTKYICFIIIIFSWFMGIRIIQKK